MNIPNCLLLVTRPVGGSLPGSGALLGVKTWLSTLQIVYLCLSDETLKTVGPFYLASSNCVKVVVELQILECGRARDVHVSTVDLNTVSQLRLW